MSEITGTGTDLYSQFIHKSRYSRWLQNEGRRETWSETVERYVGFWMDRFPDHQEEISALATCIREANVMPSMRAMMTAGKALERDEMSGFNCSFMCINHPRAFDEMMYILMCGTGVGYSVERQHIVKLPIVNEDFHETDTTIVVADSKIGWSKAFKELISLLYTGEVPQYDLSKIRAKGARLKTFGGRASGPDPLDSLFKFTIQLFRRAAGRRLSSIEVHDLCCKIADIVVCGGVRRSALISLSNLSDDRMRNAKSGQWWVDEPQRQLANNSSCLTERPDFEVFLSEWMALYRSKSGERGFFNLEASRKQAARWGKRDPSLIFGTNPCAEIILRALGLCNLSEVIIRPWDTIETIREKVRVATIFGTLQSSLTDFRYVRSAWSKNAQEERLLGVSMTGILDHQFFGVPSDELKAVLNELRDYAVQVNEEWAAKLGIEPSAAITCVKPSGTVSQLCNTSSGIHPRFSQYYIRRVRIDKKDAIGQFMKDRGVPCENDHKNPDALVFSFPIRNPIEGMPMASNIGAMAQLELWEFYQDNWCHHKPSCTVYYRDDEFLEVGQWLWEKLDKVSGLSFLPYSDHIYEQPPYDPISEEKYNELMDGFPESVDWLELSEYEDEDNTIASQELACSSGVCDVVDLLQPG